MSNLRDKYKWLQLAFTEEVDKINESYYYDRRDDEFFSVFITDLLITAPNATNNYPNNPYSKKELEILTERINRIEDNDTSILDIPRLTVDERKLMMRQFLEFKTDLTNNIDLEKIIDAENGRTNLEFDNHLKEKDQADWENFKANFVEQKIDTFCNLQNINLDTASLWTDKKMTSMSFDL